MMANPPDPPSHLRFYHTVEFAPGRWTSGWPVIRPIVDMIRQSMDELSLVDRRVLDVGCRDGALSFAAERLGAREVIGVDHDLPSENIAFLSDALASQVSFVESSLFDLRPSGFGEFDLVILAGVLYHLRYPFMGLRVLRDLVNDGGTLLIETAILDDGGSLPLLFCPTGKASPYEPTSCTFFNRRGFTDSVASLGFSVIRHRSLFDVTPLEQSGDERVPINRTVFVCRRDRSLDDPVTMDYWDGSPDPTKLPGWPTGVDH